MCDIFSWYLVSHILQAYSSNKVGSVLKYINKVKSRHGIGLPETCGYQSFGEKQVLMLEICLLTTSIKQHNIAYCFAWKFYFFTWFPILEGYIIEIKNYDCDKYFIIFALGEPGG